MRSDWWFTVGPWVLFFLVLLVCGGCATTFPIPPKPGQAGECTATYYPAYGVTVQRCDPTMESTVFVPKTWCGMVNGGYRTDCAAGRVYRDEGGQLRVDQVP